LPSKHGGLAQLARALAWHARGHRFDSDILHIFEPSKLTLGGFFLITPMHHINTQATHNKELPRHFYLLDTVRGFAALSIVIWHWQHFYLVDTNTPDNFISSRQPFFHVLYLFYTNGAFAVDFFFSLSGFIFFYLYKEKITKKEISFKRFSILRFSRLYPLHFVTLIAVLILQLFIFKSVGRYIIYPDNDFYNFILNLFFIQSWGIETGNSFNSPSWSVSVEILLYGLFFGISYLKLNNRYVISILIILAVCLQTLYSPISRGIMSFFEGGVIYYLYLAINQKNRLKHGVYLTGCLALMLTIAIIVNVYFNNIIYQGLQTLATQHLHIAAGKVTKLISVFNHLGLKLVYFPLVILYLALLETAKGPIAKNIAFIGSISFSSYLIHFPLQLLVILFCNKFHVDLPTFADSPFSLVAFFAVLIGISVCSFNYFELPVQNYIRRKF
jgi:peptidoglycan/LPS O-acetylase OafA/YrhL